jgi:phosphoribosyl 1,2-cyclic phosphate phosphodiesterase
MSFTVRVLGCGSSGGVPRPALGWGHCDPTNPLNRRRRCSILVRRRGREGVTTVLVDTSPDLREQLIDADVDWLDGVLFTHDHADHTHGIDDLRSVAIHGRRRVIVHCDAPTSAVLHQRFGYCFTTPPGSEYPPILDERRIVLGGDVTVSGKGGDVTAAPIRLHHGPQDALGFRFGDMAYTPDVGAIPEESVDALRGLDLWIIDALRHAPHPSHFSLSDALGWIERLKPRRAVLTNLHSDLDHGVLARSLPPGVVPAHDGLTLEF